MPNATFSKAFYYLVTESLSQVDTLNKTLIAGSGHIYGIMRKYLAPAFTCLLLLSKLPKVFKFYMPYKLKIIAPEHYSLLIDLALIKMHKSPVGI